MHAVADACLQQGTAPLSASTPILAHDAEHEGGGQGGRQRAAGGGTRAPPLRALIRAAAAAIKEQSGALRNHPNATLYAAIGRLIPYAGHFLELEPCLVCLEHEKRSGGDGAGRKSDGGGGGGASEAASVTAAAVAMLGPGSVPPGTVLAAQAGGSAGGAVGTGSAGGGGGAVFLNYALDSVKSATKWMESAIMVSTSPCALSVSSFLAFRWGFWRLSRLGVLPKGVRRRDIMGTRIHFSIHDVLPGLCLLNSVIRTQLCCGPTSSTTLVLSETDRARVSVCITCSRQLALLVVLPLLVC